MQEYLSQPNSAQVYQSKAVQEYLSRPRRGAGVYRPEPTQVYISDPLSDVNISEMRTSFNPVLVPPPPSAFFKLEDKFVYDDIEKEDPDAEEVPTDPYHLYFIAFMVLGAGKFH